MADLEDEKQRASENLSQLFDSEMADFFEMSQMCDDGNNSNRLSYTFET